jgi:2C-methyl-D-erythritol 2,4-cyclodiphosphate synthase
MWATRAYRVVNVDVTCWPSGLNSIPFKPQMSTVISGLLGCPANVKAGTNEGVDAVGRGEAVACARRGVIEKL